MKIKPPGLVRLSFWLIFLCCSTFGWVALGSASAQGSPLQGTPAEAQAIREMQGRLKTALSKGDVAACNREGQNLAKYSQDAAGRALIEEDVQATDLRIRQAGELYDYFRQIRDLNAQQAVDKAYGLIRAVAAKMAEDAVKEVAVTLITAPVPGVGRIVAEMGKQSAEFLGNFNDSGQLVNRVRALQQLQQMAKYSEEQMKSLLPAIRAAEAKRGVLAQCRTQFTAGVAAVKGAQPVNLNNLSKAKQDQLLACACKCSTGCAAAAGFSLTGFDASPSCKNVTNGPCFCNGFGCLRDTLKAPCVKACLAEINVKADDQTIGEWVNRRNAAAGVTVPGLSPSNAALNKPAMQSSRSSASRDNDPQGAVDGVKNGSFGFHTDNTVNPWWQVDLGRVQPVSEVRIYNRLDCCAERARTIQVMLSSDGQQWQTAYRHDGSVFGGVDGKPLKVALKGQQARFIRLQLNEHNALHLDEVEVTLATTPAPPAATGGSSGPTSTLPNTCSAPVKLYDNWNTAACQTTDALTFRLDQPARIARLELWSDTSRPGATPLIGTLDGPGLSLPLNPQRGSCQWSWCLETVTVNRTLPAGEYRLQVSGTSLCQNPESQGTPFIRIYGCP